MSTPPELAQLLTSLGELGLKNSAGAIATRIQTLRAAKHSAETINELVEIVNDLLEDRGQLIGIARALQDTLVAQRITDTEIEYITNHLIPTVERLAKITSGAEEATEMVGLLKTIVTAETLTVLQLVGFNFKAAIGEPLTALVQSLILSQIPDRRSTPGTSVHLGAAHA